MLGFWPTTRSRTPAPLGRAGQREARLMPALSVQSCPALRPSAPYSCPPAACGARRAEGKGCAVGEGLGGVKYGLHLVYRTSQGATQTTAGQLRGVPQRPSSPRRRQQAHRSQRAPHRTSNEATSSFGSASCAAFQVGRVAGVRFTRYGLFNRYQCIAAGSYPRGY
jgi:hypothetical protein